MNANKHIKTRPTMLSWAIIPIFGIIFTTQFSLSLANYFKPETAPPPKISYEKISNQDLPEIALPQNGAVTFWFDDAWSSQFTEGFPILSSNGIKAAIAVPTSLIGYDAYMKWEEMRIVAKSGWEITSHSKTHNCEIDNLTFEDLNNEIEGSKNDLLKHGMETDIYVAPCGVTNEMFNSIVLYHYKHQRLVEPGFNDIPPKNNYALNVKTVQKNTTEEDIRQWFQEAEKNNSWLILMLHQIQDDGPKYSTSKDMLRKIAKITLESETEIVLPTQILRYKI